MTKYTNIQGDMPLDDEGNLVDIIDKCTFHKAEEYFLVFESSEEYSAWVLENYPPQEVPPNQLEDLLLRKAQLDQEYQDLINRLQQLL